MLELNLIKAEEIFRCFLKLIVNILQYNIVNDDLKVIKIVPIYEKDIPEFLVFSL